MFFLFNCLKLSTADEYYNMSNFYTNVISIEWTHKRKNSHYISMIR
ncbi:hypothetical protein D1AOALGA4SA_11582 [Olavius algarvensis Delta 1 endosymbiont]|nr:hypothetical protein D1AOALGA4SA_11582 [Olavius algarvensis Delta 1 endosymbiont]